MKYNPPILLIVLLSFLLQTSKGQSKSATTPDKALLSLENKIQGLYNTVLDEGRLTENFRPEDAHDLPVGITKSVGGLEFIIVLDSAIAGGNGMICRASMYMEFPGTNQRIALVADDVLLHQDGIVAAKLKPIKNYILPMGRQELVIKQEGTYVEWDCAGYKLTSLQAEMQLSRKIVLPVNKNGDIDPNPEHKVTGTFTTTYQDMGDIMVDIQFSSFQVNGLKDFVFHPGKTSLDFSDLRNPSGFVIPRSYESPLLAYPGDPLWRGVFIEDFTVDLPESIGDRSKSERLGIYARNLLIDGTGVSGEFGVQNILPIDKGQIASWPFSIDELGVLLVQNRPEGFGMKGRLKLPISEEPMGYEAVLNASGDYAFTVSVTEEMDVPMLGGELKLAKNSYVTIQETRGNLEPKAVLHGSLSITALEALKIDKIEFQDLKIQTTAPEISVKYFAAETGVMKNFPISIDKIGLHLPDQHHVGLAMNITLNFQGSGEGGLKGTGGIIVWAEKDRTKETAKWEFDKLAINEVYINTESDAFSLEGYVKSYDKDPTYGDGFEGMISATFTPGLSVKAKAQFGNVKGFRYFYADAMVRLPKGLPIVPPLALYGFGGGLYHHMSQEMPAKIDLPAEGITEMDESGQPGVSLSGCKYVPNKSVGLGIKASVLVGDQSEIDLYNALCTFYLETNSGGGIRELGFTGDIRVMASPDKKADEVPMYAQMLLKYTPPSRELFGSFSAYVDYGLIKGSGANNLAGSAVIYFSPDDWYVYIGKPEQRVGLKMMGIIETTSYFMCGTQVPAIPAPPDKVTNYLDLGARFYERDGLALQTGGGLAFGSGLSMDTGEISFLMLYGRLALELGFDVLVKKYSESVECIGRSSFGLNKWYAEGQAYAYILADLGIKVKLFRRTKKISIARIETGAWLYAALPNPTYMAGKFKASYSVLGGMVSGSCQFEFEVGEECEMAGGSPVEGLEVISQLSPSSGSTDVDVFSVPQAAFNMKIGHSFELVDEQKQRKAFKIILDNFDVLKDGKAVKGELVWNSNNDVVAFDGHEILPGESNLEAYVKVHFEELENGQWKTVEIEGEPYIEERKVNFRTDVAPKYIPQHNVEYSYPVNGQLNFHKDEYTAYKGYVKLKDGQEYLFKTASGWEQELKFISASGEHKVSYSYDVANMQLNFDIPKNLSNETIYQVLLVNIPPKGYEQEIDLNVSDILTERSEAEVIKTKEINEDEQLITYQDNEVYKLYFRTSRYNTFKQKMASVQKIRDYSDPMFTGIHRMMLDLGGDEGFDKTEMPTEKAPFKLISFKADMTGNEWYNSYVYPKYYQGTVHKDISLDTDTPDLGIPPFRAIYMKQLDGQQELTHSHVVAGAVDVSFTKATVVYEVSYNIYNDYLELKRKLLQNNLEGYNSRTKEIVTGAFIGEFLEMDYKFVAEYTLPGIKQVTSSVPLKIYYGYDK